MSGTSLTFYLFAGLAVVGALGVVTLKNLMHSALSLAVTLIAVAGVFVLLEATFLAAIQILLYAGGIMVLLVFAIMLTQRLMGDQQSQINHQWMVALGLCAALGVVMRMVMSAASFPLAPSSDLPNNVAAVGERLLTTHVLPFELASMLLLAAMIGVVVIARRES